MPARAYVQTKGLNKLMIKLAKLEGDIDKAAQEAVLAGAEVAQKGMIRRAPVDTGNLRAHIKIKGPDIDGNFVVCEVGIIHDKNLTDAETARYATAQEYGTSSMAAHPFIRPTMHEDKRKITTAIRKVFKAYIKQGEAKETTGE